MITYQQKSFENQNTVDIESVTKEHPKTSRELFQDNTDEKTSQVGSNNSLYSNTKKCKIFKQKDVKITKRAQAFKGFACSYEVETLNHLTLNYNF